ncbi:MAG: DUF1275 domain-containing protein [Labilithrix sp.]|nr:DUF1275 domain-containing protein [Labilithrix sp.]
MGAFSSESRIFAPRHVLGWVLFTLSAGFVNAGALAACKNFVTHITGNVTNIAAEPAFTTSFFLVVAAFIGGGILAIVVAESAKTKPKLAFALPVLLASLVLFGVATAGRTGLFGPFGEGDDVNPRAFTLLVVLAAAMGMVNASVAVATDNQIRITHLTGPATDLAGNIVRAALGTGKGTRTELRWAFVRVAKFTAFAVGAGIAAKLSSKLQFDAFAVAGGTLALALGCTAAPEPVEAPQPEAEGAFPVRYEDAMPPFPPPKGREREEER